MAALTVNQVIKALQELVENDPKVGEMQTVYSKDDEGNCFRENFCEPTIGYYYRREFKTDESYESEFNAVCIN